MRLPWSLTSLDLCGDGVLCGGAVLRWKSREGLVGIMKALPIGLKRLNLSGDWFHGKPVAELVLIMKAMPLGLTSLSFGDNALCGRSSLEVAMILKALPIGLKSLEFGRDWLSGKTTAEVMRILEVLPAELTNLNLSRSGLGKKSLAELVEILKLLPKGLTSLNLSCNELGEKSTEELVRLLKLLPPGLKHLDLSENKLQLRRSTTELLLVLGVLPAVLGSLDLSYNWLSWCSEFELEQIFEVVPLGCDIKLGPEEDKKFNLKARLKFRKAMELIQKSAFSTDPGKVSLVAGAVEEDPLHVTESSEDWALRSWNLLGEALNLFSEIPESSRFFARAEQEAGKILWPADYSRYIHATQAIKELTGLYNPAALVLASQFNRDFDLNISGDISPEAVFLALKVKAGKWLSQTLNHAFAAGESLKFLRTCFPGLVIDEIEIPLEIESPVISSATSLGTSAGGASGSSGSEEIFSTAASGIRAREERNLWSSEGMTVGVIRAPGIEIKSAENLRAIYHYYKALEENKKVFPALNESLLTSILSSPEISVSMSAVTFLMQSLSRPATGFINAAVGVSAGAEAGCL